MNDSPLIPEEILRFLNALPTTGDTVEWILQFRAALQELLGDVDRVAIRINIICDIFHPHSYNPAIELSLHTKPELMISRRIMANRIESMSPAERMIAEFKRLGYPLDDYQPPCCYQYSLAERAYLATLLLFKRRGNHPISEDTLYTMNKLEPFMIFAFSGLVTRHYMTTPVEHLFTRMLSHVQTAAGLSNRECHIMALHLCGLSYTEIACQLFISENTVAKHVKSAHRKTGCASFLELFRPYFGDLASKPGP